MAVSSIIGLAHFRRIGTLHDGAGMVEQRRLIRYRREQNDDWLGTHLEENVSSETRSALLNPDQSRMHTRNSFLVGGELPSKFCCR